MRTESRLELYLLFIHTTPDLVTEFQQLVNGTVLPQYTKSPGIVHSRVGNFKKQVSNNYNFRIIIIIHYEKIMNQYPCWLLEVSGIHMFLWHCMNEGWIGIPPTTCAKPILSFIFSRQNGETNTYSRVSTLSREDNKIYCTYIQWLVVLLKRTERNTFQRFTIHAITK